MGPIDLDLLAGQKEVLVFTSKGHLTRTVSEWGCKWDSSEVFLTAEEKGADLSRTW